MVHKKHKQKIVAFERTRKMDWKENWRSKQTPTDEKENRK